MLALQKVLQMRLRIVKFVVLIHIIRGHPNIGPAIFPIWIFTLFLFGPRIAVEVFDARRLFIDIVVNLFVIKVFIVIVLFDFIGNFFFGALINSGLGPFETLRARCISFNDLEV